jgi:hypothetical protein
MNTTILGLTSAALLFAGSAVADLTLTGRSTVMSMNMPSTSQERIYLKKSWLRRDQLDRGKAYTYIYDLNGRDISALDHSLRQLQVYEMKTLDNAPEARISQNDLKLDLKPAGLKHNLGSWLFPRLVIALLDTPDHMTS